MNNCVHALGSVTSDVEWDNPEGQTGQTTFRFFIKSLRWHYSTMLPRFSIALLIRFNLGLDVLVKSLELVHVRFLGGPANAHTLLLVGLGDLLYCQYIPILGSTMYELLTRWQMNIPCGSAPVRNS